MLQQQQATLSSTRPCRCNPWHVAVAKRYDAHIRRRRCRNVAAAALDSCTLMAVASNVSHGSLYEVGQFMNSLVQQELTDVSPATCGAVLLAGLLTSLSPCTLSVLPLTIGYIAGYADTQQQQQQQQQQAEQECCSSPSEQSSSSSLRTAASPSSPPQQQPHTAGVTAATDPTTSSNSSRRSGSNGSSSSSLTVQALCFSLGLASSLAALGVVSAGVGRAYGQIGSGLPSAVALLAVLMGLNLLEVIRVPLPSLFSNVDVRSAGLPPQLAAYAAGALFALAASPCSTPVLASLLAYASTQDNPLTGGLLLFTYSCGYVVPLLVAATATGAAKRLLELRQYSAWVTPASGVLLVSGGTYALLSRLLPSL